MSSASPSLVTAAPRRKFGTYSLVLAVVAFVVFSAGFGVYVQVPSPTNEAGQWAVQWLALLAFLAVVSIIELTGTALGVAALFRPGDRKMLGLLRAGLELLQLIGGVVLGIIMIAHVGGR